MAQTSFDWADRILDGGLTARLRAARRAEPKRTYEQIVEDLRPFGIDVSRETIRRWLVRIDENPSKVA